MILPVLALLVFRLKLALRARSFGLFHGHPHPVVTKLTNRVVLLPVLTFTLKRIFRLRPLFFVNVVLVTYSPNNDSSGVFSVVTGKSMTLSMSLATYDDVVALFAVPIVVRFTARFMSDGLSVSVRLPMNDLVVRGLILVLLPVMTNVLAEHCHPRVTRELRGVLSGATFPTLVLLTAVFFVRRRTAVANRFNGLNLYVSVLVLLTVKNNMILSGSVHLGQGRRHALVVRVNVRGTTRTVTITDDPFMFGGSVVTVPTVVCTLVVGIVLLICIKVMGQEWRAGHSSQVSYRSSFLFSCHPLRVCFHTRGG